MNTKKLCLLLSLFWVSPLFAETPLDCPDINSTGALLRCAMDNAPQVQDLKLASIQAEHGIAAQGQTINPRVEFQGEGIGSNNTRYEFGYYHTIELGGKRERRKDLARSQVSLAQAQMYQARQQVAVATMTDLVRLRQIRAEQGILTEAIRTFEALIARFTKARGLSPEQKASVTAFILAKEETDLHQTALANEEDTILGGLELLVGKKLVNISSILPQMSFKWEVLVPQSINAPELQLAQAAIDLAEAEAQIQASVASSNLELGPRLIAENTSSGQTTRLGFLISLPLPLYHSNQGGRSQAEVAKERARTHFERTQSRLQQELERSLRIYRSASAAFKRNVRHNEVKHQHSELHGFIKRGLVEASVVIEVHRQILAYQRQLHLLELEGVSAYWRLQALQGNIQTMVSK